MYVKNKLYKHIYIYTWVLSKDGVPPQLVVFPSITAIVGWLVGIYGQTHLYFNLKKYDHIILVIQVNNDYTSNKSATLFTTAYKHILFTDVYLR